MVTKLATRAKQSVGRETRWNFSDSCRSSLLLEEFLAEKDAAGFKFFAGEEPWLVGIERLNWQTFFRVCTKEMDDLSRGSKTRGRVLSGNPGSKNPRKVSLAGLEAALNLQYAEQYENKVYQYRWALRHPVVREAITRALANRLPSR